MKALWCAATTFAFAAAVSLPPAMAQGSKPAGGTTVPAPNATAAPPHYEWQYHYAGRHARWQRDWILVR